LPNDDMAKEILRYDRMIESAMRTVVRQALTEVAEHGLPGDHHFYLTFRTDHGGVTLPDYLRAKYPKEMTIVLQFQFWGLDIGEDAFSVSLSFGGKRERVTVPYAALTVFADPAVKFTLPLQMAALAAQLEATGKTASESPAPAESASHPPAEPVKELPAAGGGKVVALDAFRKK
jgi:hypothetical protein